MENIFHDFLEMEFPIHRDIVYVFHYLKDGETLATPFYVGKTSKHVGRIGDYLSAQFTASTDFKVGEAARYLRARGFRVVIKYKESIDRKAEEKHILQILTASRGRLLNNLAGYNYKHANEEDERTKIHQFMDEMIAISHPGAELLGAE